LCDEHKYKCNCGASESDARWSGQEFGRRLVDEFYGEYFGSCLGLELRVLVKRSLGKNKTRRNQNPEERHEKRKSGDSNA
jgi:hypothetical protein